MILRKGDRGEDVAKLQRGLNAKGFHPGPADGIFGTGTEEAVEEFQRLQDLYPDGVFGPASIKKWNAIQKAEYQFTAAEPVPADPKEPLVKLSWTNCVADPLCEGYSKLSLRSDTAVAYNLLRKDVLDLGGVITTAGGKRGLNQGASASRSKVSFHYTGRAMDLATYSGMQNPATDPYLVNQPDATSRKFEVWCKVLDDKAPQAATVETVTLPYVVSCRQFKDAKGLRRSQMTLGPWTGKAFNLTALMRKWDFTPINARRDFMSGGSYAGAEWWHFSWTSGLVVGRSTFGEELLKVYSKTECERFIYWKEVSNAVFGIDWL